MRYFRTTPGTYAQLQPAIDAAFYGDYIATGRCEHILPEALAPQADGLCYMALADWMTSAPGAGSFLAGVEEITREMFDLNTQPETNL